MFLGDDVIAQVFSFVDRTNIPYLIKRRGKPRSQGGTGYKLSCNCPSRQDPCKHIRVMKDLARAGHLLTNDHYVVSDLGREHLEI